MWVGFPEHGDGVLGHVDGGPGVCGWESQGMWMGVPGCVVVGPGECGWGSQSTETGPEGMWLGAPGHVVGGPRARGWGEWWVGQWHKDGWEGLQLTGGEAWVLVDLSWACNSCALALGSR